MTHNQYEKGNHLTINNATKDQLKFMVTERDTQIKELQKRLF